MNLLSFLAASLLFLPDPPGAKDGISPRDPPPSVKIIRPAKIYLKKKKSPRNGQTATTPHSVQFYNYEMSV
jgi:hypothetical protein